jgi:hypothetical protein
VFVEFDSGFKVTSDASSCAEKSSCVVLAVVFWLLSVMPIVSFKNLVFKKLPKAKAADKLAKAIFAERLLNSTTHLIN